MATRESEVKRAAKSPPPIDVDDFMLKLDHPLKPALEAVRKIILDAHPQIAEGIKWNCPSFRVQEYFATINIRDHAVLIILHLGAKVRNNSSNGMKVNDPAGLLEWLAKDRAAVKFTDMKSVKAHRAAFAEIIRQWIAFL